MLSRASTRAFREIDCIDRFKDGKLCDRGKPIHVGGGWSRTSPTMIAFHSRTTSAPASAGARVDTAKATARVLVFIARSFERSLKERREPRFGETTQSNYAMQWVISASDVEGYVSFSGVMNQRSARATHSSSARNCWSVTPYTGGCLWRWE